MITFAKGVTSGYLPLGGVIAGARRSRTPFWAEGAPPFRHGYTYTRPRGVLRGGASRTSTSSSARASSTASPSWSR